jgi:RecJ-like exonuclease
MRYLALFVLVAGCSSPVGDLQPFIAVTGHYSILDMGKPAPESDVCPTCHGTKKLGDGKVFVTCPACNGTGKKTSCKDAKCNTVR